MIILLFFVQVYHAETYDKETNCADLTNCAMVVKNWAMNTIPVQFTPIFIHYEAKDSLTGNEWDEFGAKMIALFPFSFILRFTS